MVVLDRDIFCADRRRDPGLAPGSPCAKSAVDCSRLFVGPSWGAPLNMRRRDACSSNLLVNSWCKVSHWVPSSFGVTEIEATSMEILV